MYACKTALQTIKSWRNTLMFVLPLLALLISANPSLRAQATATLLGTVTDAKGAVIVGANVTILNQITKDVRTIKTNKDGLFAVPNLNPSTYSVKIVATGFSPKELTDIELHAADEIKLPPLDLAVGSVSDTVTVEVASQILTTANGERTELLSYQDIQDMALEGRDTSELLKVLPGVVTITSGTTNNTPSFTFLSITTGQSAIGQGLNANGAPNRGGTTLMIDGVSVLDPGADFSSLVTLNPEMTQEVNVLSTNFDAATPFGPVVVSSISKSGGAKFHGEGYFDARNDVLNANDWQDNHTGHPKGGAAYYYPGGGISGPVPHTQDKLLFYGGFELLYQNQGNNNILKADVPTSEMLKGDFTTDNPDNNALCPSGFNNSNQNTATLQGWCNNIANTPTFPSGVAVANPYYTILPDGTTPTPSPLANPTPTTTAGGTIPSRFINPNTVALASLFPAPNVTTQAGITATGGYNYYLPIINHDNGWMYRARVDYNWTERSKFYIAYQQGYDRQLADGCGTNIYSCSAGNLEFPGGGLYKTTYSKMVSGHFVHIFNATTTNEFIASWVYGSIPTAPQNPSADYRTTLGITLPTVYGGVSTFAPTFTSSSYGNPGITQADIFEPGNFYKVLKTIPTFQDNFTKVLGKHTIKAGAFASNTDNFQGNMGTNLQGSLGIASGSGGLLPNYFASQGTCTICGTYTGNVGTYNTTAAFVMGHSTNYSESNSGPLQDLAYQTLAFYLNDDFKVTKKLTMAIGFRIEHIGHWYDRQGIGIADFFPQRVLPDFYAGKVNPGFYWHGIDPSVPLSGQPNRLAYVSPRFGVSYDLFGNGKTLLRGGWGAYRFAEQYNDASNALTTAQAVKQYSASAFTSGHSFELSQLSQLVPANCQTQCATTSTQYGFDANDYGLPLTYSYNFTIDQQLPWKMLLDVAYVGNQTHKLSDTGATLTTGGQLTESYANQNKTPLGAYFKADPITGITACNPENLGGPCSPLNTAADYQPFGKVQSGACAGVNVAPCVIYGTSGVYQSEHIAYANYNGLQVALVKRAGKVTLNINATYSKALATINNYSPFNYRADYGFDTGERPFIFSSSYIYRAGNLVHGNAFLDGALNGWTISGISTWQEGGDTLPTVNMQYDPATFTAGVNAPAGTTTGIGASTYYGTNAGISIRPVITCNPTAGLAYHQVFKACFAPPAPPPNPGTTAGIPTPGTYGGQAVPYVPFAAYLDNDLALYKSFTVHNEHKIQFRISAFNWLNHPLPNFSGAASQTNEYYYINYQTRAVYPNSATTGSTTSATLPTFGGLDYKNASPGQRILELDLKYSF